MINKVWNYVQQEHMFEAHDYVVAGVSGGADSVCLLFMLLEIRKRIPLTLHVVHVNHGLRPEAVEEASYVEELCKKHQISFTLVDKKVDEIAREKHMSTEEAGREVRYEAFERVLAEYALGMRRNGKIAHGKIAIAHNQNDCSETFLFHLFRGSGLKGLAGIRPVRGNIVRPLLCVSRAEIEAFLCEKEISYCIDKSNLEDNYTRNRIRHHILPVACKEVSVSAVSHIKEASDKIAQAYELIEALVMEGYDTCVRKEAKGIFVEKKSLEKLPKTLQSYVCHRVLEQAAGSQKDIETIHVQQLQELLENQCGKRVHLPYGLEAVREYDGIYVRKQGQQECIEDAAWEYVFSMTDKQRLEQGELVSILLSNGDELACKLLETEKNIPTNPYTKWLDYDKIKDNIVIRHRRAGDYLTIQEDNHKKLLKALLIDEKVPREQRDCLYLIAQESHIAWIIGGRISNYFKISDDTKRMIEMKYIRRK